MADGKWPWPNKKKGYLLRLLTALDTDCLFSDDGQCYEVYVPFIGIINHFENVNYCTVSHLQYHDSDCETDSLTVVCHDHDQYRYR